MKARIPFYKIMKKYCFRCPKYLDIKNINIFKINSLAHFFDNYCFIITAKNGTIEVGSGNGIPSMYLTSKK